MSHVRAFKSGLISGDYMKSSFLGYIFQNWLASTTFLGWERMAAQRYSAGFGAKAELKLIVSSLVSLTKMI